MKKLIVRHFEELHNVLHPDGSLTQEKRADPKCFLVETSLDGSATVRFSPPSGYSGTYYYGEFKSQQAAENFVRDDAAIWSALAALEAEGKARAPKKWDFDELYAAVEKNPRDSEAVNRLGWWLEMFDGYDSWNGEEFFLSEVDPQCCGFLRYIYAFDCDEFEGVASLDELVDEDVFEQLGFAHSY